MAPMRGVVEISSDEEDLSDVGDDAVMEDLDDAMIMSDKSSPPELQNTAMPDDLEIRSEMSSQPAGAGREEEDDDCVILADDPGKGEEEGSAEDCSSDELEIVSAKGPIAYRDYPHSRHLCSNLPFSTTSHVEHCSKCHCFVCDAPAPCNFWADHCHATDKVKMWQRLRKSFRCKSLPASGHPSRGNSSPSLNDVRQKQQRHASVGVSLRVARDVSTPRAGRVTGNNAHIAQNAIFKRVGSRSPGLTTRNAYRIGSAAAAPESSLMYPDLALVSQPVQVAPRANAFSATTQKNTLQRSFRAPIVSPAQQAQSAAYCHGGLKGTDVTGPQLSQCTSLATQRTQCLPEQEINASRKCLEELFGTVVSDDLGLPHFSFSFELSRPATTNSGHARHGLVRQPESSSAMENLTASQVHDLSNHTTGDNVQADAPLQATDNLHRLNHQNNLVRNESLLNIFATASTDGLSAEAAGPSGVKKYPDRLP